MGRSSDEQKDTLIYQQHGSPPAWVKRCGKLPSDNLNQCVHPEVPTSTLFYGKPPNKPPLPTLSHDYLTSSFC